MKRSLLVCAVLFLLCAKIVLAQEKSAISGTVQDKNSSPLVGVSVQEKGTSSGTVTDANGAFKLSIAPNATLIFTYIGYLMQEVPAGGRTTFNIKLAEDTKGLQEVVVTAMGIKRERRKLGYAISTVSGEDIIKSAPTNFASALYGKAAGVRIQSAPGGGTSAVTIKIRGLNSLNLQNDNQPLIVVDGVPIRNDFVNNGDYWSDTRIRGNSLLDINPDNIQDISILKGAAATALYGSSGSNGVVMITTKSGSSKPGIGVDFNYSFGVENVSVLPDIQTEYGPGYDRATNLASYGAADGWVSVGDVNGDGKTDYRLNRAYAQFGSKYDGREIYYWDGTFRKYEAHPDNWKDFYQTGYSSIANVAVSNANDKLSYRLSYTRNDYKGIQRGGKQEKNTVNFNTNYKITSKLSTDIVVNYVNEYVHNRPEQINRITANYNGFIGPAEDMNTFLDKYKTSKGYKWVPSGTSERDPEEALKYDLRPTDALDWFWKQFRNSYDEKSNRVISSLTLNYDIIDGLKLRGRVGNDFTGYSAETKNYSEYPVAFGQSGAYATATNSYNIIYADVLLSYNKALSADFDLNASLGYQARKEERRYNNISTKDGLLQENLFTLTASKSALDGNGTKRTYYQQDGLFGILGLSYKDFLFLEGTGRYERISTLAPDKNAYFYPSVSLSFELSKAAHLPKIFDYSKLRASYGIVATPPGLYQANIVYNAYNLSGTAILYPTNSYGNDELKPEMKHEREFGLETRMFNGRFGLDVSYYNNIIKGQIIPLSIPSSTGASTIWQNVGDLKNYGVEAALNGTPITTNNFEWNIRGTIGFNRNELKSLMPGLEQLIHSNIDNGSLLIVSNVGQTAGDILAWAYQKDDQGRFIIDENGYYNTDFSKREKVGNIQPNLVGGIGNTLRYKNLSLDFLVDYRWGGQIVSPTNFYAMGAGMFKSTLPYRDAERGGLTYYEDADGNRTRLTNGGSAPPGTTLYHDGLILNGVDATGKDNDKILSAAEYYVNSFQWGNYSGNATMNNYRTAVYDNNYIKLREVALNYTLPVKLANKARLQHLTVGVFGRNLFYFYKSLPNLDPEVAVGTNFVSQGMESGTTAASRTIGANLRLSF